MNEVNETLRCIRNDIEFHKLALNDLDGLREFVKDLDIPKNHRSLMLECIDFKKDFHNHKITELKDAHKELIFKYK